MLKRKFSKLGELGSMMVEAMAMLGLISMVTPIVYKKAAERNMEIQDVNAASQMRNLIKGVDEYISDNYGRIVEGKKVDSTCAAGDFTYNFGAKDYIEVPIGHFCDYLPYGFIDVDGNAVDSKVFNGDYKVVIKKMESEITAAESSDPMTKYVLTGFVLSTPKNADFPRIRASRISSMVGGNGGYVEDNEAFGVQGLWGINDIEDELGVSATNGALLTSSASPISSGGTNDDAVLYRRFQTRRNLNAMETTLFMGLTEGDAQDIQNINQAVIVGTKLLDADPTAEDSLDKALLIKNGGGAFVDGVLAVAAKTTGTSAFYVDLDGALRAAGEGTGKSIIDTDPASTALAGKFEINKDGALRTSDGKFLVDENGAISAAVNGVATDPDGTTSSYANFTVDKDGNVVAKGNAEIEKDLRVKGRSVLGDKNYNINTPITGIDFSDESNYELVVNGHAFIKGLLKVFHFKAETIDAGVLRAGTDRIDINDHTNYTLYVDKDKFAVGPLDNTTRLQDAKVTIQTETGNTQIKGGDFLVQTADESVRILEANNMEEYVYTSGLRAGNREGGNYPLEVENDTRGNVTMKLREAGSSVVGYDTADNEFMAFDNDSSMIQKKSETGEGYGNIIFKKDSSIIETQETTGVASRVEVFGSEINMDVTPTDTINNFELTRRDATATADLALRNSSGVKVFNKNEAGPVLYVDPESESKDDNADRTLTEAGRGGVYIRRGVVDLESNNQADYNDVSSRFTAKGKKDVGYVRADMVIGMGVDQALDRNKGFYGGNDAATDAGQYDSFMVNPAYTSVMHDIKLTSRGGARLSDILPDFINKGIYLADNTYEETLGNWGNITYTPGAKITTSADGRACSGTNIYECKTSPWLGVVPTPQCPPGYQKVIQVFPYGFNIAQAGSVGGKKRDDFYIIADQTEQYFDPSKDSEQPMPLYFQKNTWLRTRATKIKENADFLGWYLLMGYVYPVSDFQTTLTSLGATSDVSFIQRDSNNYIWNLYPVYYRELEAYANVYCYFARTNFNDDFVDTKYDQIDNFRMPINKGNDAAIKRLDDPNMNYKNPW